MDSTLLLPETNGNEQKSSSLVNFLRVIIKCTTLYEKCLFFIGIIFAILTGLCQPIESYACGEVAQALITITNAVNNKTIAPSDLDKAWKSFDHDMNWVAIYFLICGTAYFTFGTIQFSIFKYVGDNTTFRVRQQYISKLLRKDTQYYDSVSTGQLSTVLIDNLERFREVLNEKVGLIIDFLTDFVMGVALAFYTDWRLASYGVFFGLGLSFSGLVYSASIMWATEKQNYYLGRAGSIAFQTLGAFKTVISLNGQRLELDRYTQELRDGEKYGFKKALYAALARCVDFFFSNVLNTVILYVGANMIFSKSVEPGVVVRIFHYLLYSSICLGEAFPLISRMASAIASAAPIAEIIIKDDNEVEKDCGETNDDITVKGQIVFENVRFSYPCRSEIEVLKDISFEVKPGECIALVGASGSGKSTVVQLLLHYYNIDSGNILIDGEKINDINLKKLRKMIGVVSQEPVLFNTTIEENIKFGNPEATLPMIYDALRKANAYDFVCGFPKGIKTIVGERGTQLSGGQKQRIAIARTLVRNPKILLLDEATSALDNESEHVVQKALENASKGRTTIVVAHRLSTIRNAHKIIVMQKGEIVEVGSHNELLEKEGAYYELVNSQLLDTQDDDYEKSIVSRQTSQEPSPLHSRYSQLSRQISSVEGESEHDDEMERLLEDFNKENATKSNLREILKQCKPDSCILVLAFLGSALQGLSYPILSQLVVQVYNAYAMTGEDILYYGHFWSLTFLALGAFRVIVGYCHYYCFGKVSEKLSTRLRIQSFKHLLSLPCTFYDDPKHSPLKLSLRLNTDASNVKAAVDERLGNVVFTLVTCSVSLLSSFYYSWKMTLQMLLFCPFLCIAEHYFENATENAVQEDAIAFENSNKTAIEAIENIRTVKSLSLEDIVMKKVDHSLMKIHNSYLKRAFIQGVTNGISISCKFFIFAISYKYGAYLAMNNEIVPMNIQFVLLTISLASEIFGCATSYLPDYKKAVYAGGLIFKLFTYPATMPFDSKHGKKNISEGEVEGKYIQFHYENRPDQFVLNGIDLKLEPGKSLALVGPSGCGKSTIIFLLERFYSVVDGKLSIDNENVEDINLQHLRESVALVSQEPTLFNCSIKENLMYGLTRVIPENEIEKALITANAYQFVIQFPAGLDTVVGERGAQLSGGQKQRIAIARAILRNPKILLLDEATSALDTDSEKIVQNALDTASERLSTVIVAHRLSTVVNAHSIAVLKNGKVAEQGTHDELLKLGGIYWRLVQKQGIQPQNHTI